MKTKVWILEGFVDTERMRKNLRMTQEMHRMAVEENSPEAISVTGKMVADWEQKLVQFPEGYWQGYEGRVNLRTFCRKGKVKARYFLENGIRFRVILADLKDPERRTWRHNYENGVEDPGALARLNAAVI